MHIFTNIQIRCLVVPPLRHSESPFMRADKLFLGFVSADAPGREVILRLRDPSPGRRVKIIFPFLLSSFSSFYSFSPFALVLLSVCSSFHISVFWRPRFCGLLASPMKVARSRATSLQAKQVPWTRMSSLPSHFGVFAPSL